MYERKRYPRKVIKNELMNALCSVQKNKLDSVQKKNKKKNRVFKNLPIASHSAYDAKVNFNSLANS